MVYVEMLPLVDTTSQVLNVSIEFVNITLQLQRLRRKPPSDESTEQFLGMLLLGMVFCLLGAAASGYWIKKFKQNQASPTPAFSKKKNDYIHKSNSSNLGRTKSLIITIDKVSTVSLAKATAVTHSMAEVNSA